MVITTRREECRLLPQPLHDFKTEHARVKLERSLKVGDFEVNVADAGARVEDVSLGITHVEG